MLQSSDTSEIRRVIPTYDIHDWISTTGSPPQTNTNNNKSKESIQMNIQVQPPEKRILKTVYLLHFIESISISKRINNNILHINAEHKSKHTKWPWLPQIRF